MSSKRCIVLVLLLYLGLLAIPVTLLTTLHIPHYTNLSETQVWAQEDRWISEQAHACQQAGGTWQAGFSTAGCTVSYEPPSDAWYINPQENPWYDWWQWGKVLMVVVGIALCAIILRCLGFLWEEYHRK